MIVLDGAADRPEPELDGRTPLGIAETPFLDSLARNGKGSLATVLPNGGAPQTHSGMLSLLGYPEVAIRAKRGALEGSVVFGGMRPGCLYARGNLSSLVRGRIPSRRVNRDVSQDEADTATRLLNQLVPDIVGLPCRFTSYSTYRLAIELELGEANVSDAITSTDPGYAETEFATPPAQQDFPPARSKALSRSPGALRSADVVNRVADACSKVLDDGLDNESRVAAGRLPINYILMRDFGASLPEVPSFAARWGASAKYFHDLPVESGVARYLGMDEEVAGCSSVTERALADAGGRLLRDADRYDFLCFHVKGPDEPGHNRDWREKVDVIETVDAGLFSLIGTAWGERNDLRVVVTSDHATCWGAGTHTADPVPLIVATRNGRDPGLRLSEQSCANGTLGIARAWTLMPSLFGAGRV
jgi:2,3-bisphosphoglycerate-independent phosphoglycerate mutase